MADKRQASSILADWSKDLASAESQAFEMCSLNANMQITSRDIDKIEPKVWGDSRVRVNDYYFELGNKRIVAKFRDPEHLEVEAYENGFYRKLPDDVEKAVLKKIRGMIARHPGRFLAINDSAKLVGIHEIEVKENAVNGSSVNPHS